MSQQLILDNNVQQAKTLAWWLYLVHGASFVFSLGALSFIPLIVNYLKTGRVGRHFCTQPSQLADPLVLVVRVSGSWSAPSCGSP